MIKFTKHHSTNEMEYNAVYKSGQTAEYCGIKNVILKVFSKGKIVILDPSFTELL